MSRRVLLLSTVLLGATPSFAHADEFLPRKPESLAGTVVLADLDLSTSAGIAQARKRLTVVSVRLCRNFRDHRRADDWQTFGDCVHDTLASALERIQTPASRVARN